jgi:hypothetical protein
MFKIPEKIRIGLTEYSVGFSTPELGAILGGEIDFQKGKITIRKQMTEAMTLRTFLHEVTHGVILETASAFSEDVLLNVDDIEEHICKQLEVGLTQAIDQIVEFNVAHTEPRFSDVLTNSICSVDRILMPLLDKEMQKRFMDEEVKPVISREADPQGFCQMVMHTRKIAELLKEQIEHDKKATTDYKRIGKLANLIAEYYKKEGNGCGGNCHLVLDDSNLEDSDIQFCIGYCAHANDNDGLAIMREMLSLNPEERQKVYDMASVLTNPRYTNNLDNTKEKS